MLHVSDVGRRGPTCSGSEHVCWEAALQPLKPKLYDKHAWMPVPGPTVPVSAVLGASMRFTRRMPGPETHTTAEKTHCLEAGACLMKSRRSSIQRARELRLIMDRYSSIVKRQPSLQVQALCT